MNNPPCSNILLIRNGLHSINSGMPHWTSNPQKNAGP